MDGIYPIDAGRGGLANTQERSTYSSDLAPETGSGSGPYPCMFSGVCAVQDAGQICHQKGLGDQPRRVIDELSQIRMVDVVLPTRSGIEIRRRCI